MRKKSKKSLTEMAMQALTVAVAKVVEDHRRRGIPLAVSLCDEFTGKRTQFSSYAKTIADARAALDWLLTRLKARN